MGSELVSDKTVIVQERTRAYDGFLKIDAVSFQHARYDGSLSEPMTRLVMERGDAAAALIHDVTTDHVVLTEQFRIATHEKGPGWIQEVVAGVIEPGEAPEAALRREIREELGYAVDQLERIGRFYVSPGGTSERIHLYYAQVRPQQLVDPNASGAAAEQEDIRRVRVPARAFLSAVMDGAHEDAKTIIAGQWMWARRARRGQSSAAGR